MAVAIGCLWRLCRYVASYTKPPAATELLMTLSGLPTFKLLPTAL